MSVSQVSLESGFALHRKGDLAGAERMYRAVIKAQPANPDALYLMGMLLLDRNAGPEAARYLDRAIRAAGKAARRIDPGWRLALGTARQRSGDHDGALRAFDAALRDDPFSPDALFCRATALADLGDFAAAVQAYERLLESHPDHVEALNNFGVIHREAGRPAAAIRAFRRAVTVSPGHVDALCNLGRALSNGGSATEAIPLLRVAVDQRPDDVDLHMTLFDCLLHDSLVDEIAERARRFLDRRPDAGVFAILGSALQFQGRLDDALNMYRRALELDPACSRAHQGLVDSRTEAGRGELMTMIRNALDSDRPGPSDRTGLWFALARHHAALGEHLASFDAYVAGNDTKHELFAKRGYGYDDERMRRQVKSICDRYTSDSLARSAARSTERPVFIVGMPRSGTTLTEQILASHPQVFGGGELSLLGNAVAALWERHRHPRETAPADAFEAAADAYLAAIANLDDRAHRVTDKMPHNFMHVGLVVRLFSDARIIHCRRDPMDTCLSCFMQNFRSANLSWSTDLGETANFYCAYDRLMAHWRDVLPPGRMLEIDYEDTIRDLEGQARRVVDFAGLPWDDACLRFSESDRVVTTASHSQVRQRIYTSSVGRWRRYGDRVAPLARALDACGCGPPPSGPDA